MKTVVYSKSALKALRTIPKADAIAIMDKLASYASGQPQDVKRLKGSKSLRLRHGDWRAAFDETETKIDVATVKHRREAYK